MILFIQSILPYISGLYTLPWILVGFVVSYALTHFFLQEKIDAVMKKIGLIILYCFVPPLVFRIFLDTPLGLPEAFFVTLTCLSIILMYLIAYFFAKYQIKRHNLSGDTKTLYMKTVLTNQGRSSAFVGGIMLAIPNWGVPAGIFMAFVGIALFAVVPYVLFHMNKKEQREKDNPVKLPWFLSFYPWYFICFAIAAVILQKTTALSTHVLGDFGLVLRFYTALTIPIALYYVGSSIHPRDLKLTELKKLIGITKDETSEHWLWVRQIFILTAIITPVVFAILFGLLLSFSIIPTAWFAVIVINMVLPITSTNMFLVTYGLDKRTTAHAITWSTLIGVPITVAFISLFSIVF